MASLYFNWMESEGTGGGGDVGNNLKKFLYKGKKKVNDEKKKTKNQRIENKWRDLALKKLRTSCCENCSILLKNIIVPHTRSDRVSQLLKIRAVRNAVKTIYGYPPKINTF